MDDVVVSVSNLACRSGAANLLNNISWTVKKGERWVVFGQNGCGKTTLLSVITGFRKATSGQVQVFGERFTSENIYELRKQIGWISSSYFDKIYHRETVLDIVLAAADATLGRSASVDNELRKRAYGLLADAGLKTRMLYPFEALSKGEQQQVLIARALLLRPKILILDEPCGGLDVLGRERLLNALEAMVDESDTPIIYVTHYPEEVLPIFDKCLLLRNAAVYRQGDTKELFTSDVISDFFNCPVRVESAFGRYRFLVGAQAD